VYGLEPAKLRVLPHPYLPLRARAAAVQRPGERLRVALLGEIAYRSKGAEGYLEVMQRLRDAPIEWHVFGETDRFDFEQRLAALGRGVRVVRHGPYLRGEIVGLLQQAKLDAGLLLPIWPETFSLTLSELLAAGIPVVAASQGALRERLEGAPYAHLVESPEEAARVLSELSRERAELARMQGALAELEPPSVEPWLAAHREIYARSPAPDAVRALKRRDHVRLAASRVSPSLRPLEGTTQPAARFRASRWFRTAERLKPYLPESVRALARRRLSDNGLRALLRFRLPGRHAKPCAELRLDARYLRTARFTALGTDPCFFLDLQPLSPEQVGAVRFNVWCSHPGHTYAQLYWRHEGDPTFSEDKSLIVELNGHLGDWQEYVVRLDRKAHPSWFSEKKLVALRFDPVNYAGLFCVGELALCKPAPAR
jgi:hypothetical protein